MKNLDTLSKRILVIAISISIVALSLSALMLSAGYAFASNNSDAMGLGTDMSETTYDDTYKAIASGNALAIYNVNTGYISDYIKDNNSSKR